MAALCVVAGLGASVIAPAAAERTSRFGDFVHHYQVMMTRLMAPIGEPISPPVPQVKPSRDRAAVPKAEVLATCGYASITAKPTTDGESILYRVTFAPAMVDDMAEQGCAQFFQGCNVCNIRYEGCDDAARNACTDAACLEKTCERKVICSAKSCEARGEVGGKPLSCKSRLARASCGRKFF